MRHTDEQLLMHSDRTLHLQNILFYNFMKRNKNNKEAFEWLRSKFSSFLHQLQLRNLKQNNRIYASILPPNGDSM